MNRNRVRKARENRKSNQRQDAAVPEGVTDPHRLARAFINMHCRDGSRRTTLRYYKQEWWQWNGKYYKRVSIAEMKARLSAFAKDRIDKANLVGYTVKPKVTTGVVGNLLQALQSELLVPDVVEMPAWTNSNEHTDFIPVNNGLIDAKNLLPGRPAMLRSPSPEFFSQVALPVDYEPGATCPKFQNFLDEVLQCDAEAIAFLQEWFGYCLVTDTSLERFVILVGEDDMALNDFRAVFLPYCVERQPDGRYRDPESRVPTGRILDEGAHRLCEIPGVGEAQRIHSSLSVQALSQWVERCCPRFSL